MLAVQSAQFRCKFLSRLDRPYQQLGSDRGPPCRNSFEGFRARRSLRYSSCAGPACRELVFVFSFECLRVKQKLSFPNHFAARLPQVDLEILEGSIWGVSFFGGTPPRRLVSPQNQPNGGTIKARQATMGEAKSPFVKLRRSWTWSCEHGPARKIQAGGGWGGFGPMSHGQDPGQRRSRGAVAFLHFFGGETLQSLSVTQMLESS